MTILLKKLSSNTTLCFLVLLYLPLYAQFASADWLRFSGNGLLSNGSPFSASATIDLGATDIDRSTRSAFLSDAVLSFELTYDGTTSHWTRGNYVIEDEDATSSLEPEDQLIFGALNMSGASDVAVGFTGPGTILSSDNAIDAAIADWSLAYTRSIYIRTTTDDSISGSFSDYEFRVVQVPEPMSLELLLALGLLLHRGRGTITC